MNRIKQAVKTRWLNAITIVALSFILPVATLAAPPSSAGNTQIWNQVTVNYNNAAGVFQTAAKSNLVTVSVNTVYVAPTIISYNPASGNTDGTGATQSYQVLIRTNANGPGSVTLAAADGSPVNMAVSGTTPTITASLYLGATVFDPTDTHLGALTTVNNLATVTIAVPNDNGTVNDTGGAGAISDGIINGIKAGDVVYISNGAGGVFGPFDVTTVTDPAVGLGVTAAPGSLVLTNNTGAPISFTPAVGWLILEAKNATTVVTQGVVTTASLAASWVTTVTATEGGFSTNTPTVTTNAKSGQLTVDKYVRNATAAVVGATPLTAPAALGGQTYYKTGVNGKPTDVLEYLLVIANPGLGNATAVIATDPVPTYTTLVSSSAGYGVNNGGGVTGTFANALRGATVQAFKVDNSAGIATVGWGKATGANPLTGLMTYYIGNGSSNIAGGTVNSLETDYIIYQVTIN